MVGRLLNQYRIEKKLGEGAMGVVYRARDTRLDRDVAIKILSSDNTADSRRKARFEREAKAASALNHPNIITIYEINSTDGMDWIAMEYVRGSTLRDRIAEGPLPVRLAIQISLQMATGLAEAHQAGLIHRDLKPANIMTREDGLVKILDFGLVKLSSLEADGSGTAESDATLTALTQMGRVVGTVAYMSPEQAQGHAVDHRTDIYSLGVMLYEMLSGQRPFQGNTAIAVYHEIIYSSPRPLRKLREEMPAEVEDLVSWIMSKKPAERPATMAEVGEALQQVSAALGFSAGAMTPGASGSAPAMGRFRPPASLWRRIRKPAALAALGCGLLAGGWLIWQATRERTPSALPEGVTAYDLTKQANTLMDQYYKLGNPDRAIELYQRVIAAHPENAPALAGLADAYLRKHIESPDPVWLNLAGDNAKRALDLDSQLAAAHSAMGLYLTHNGSVKEAVPVLERAVALDPQSALAQIRLAGALYIAGRPADGEAIFRKALERFPKNGILWANYGAHLHRQGRFQETVEAFQNAVKLTPDNFSNYRNLAGALYSLERYEEAASMMQRALEIQPTAGVYSNLGTLHFFHGRFRESAEMFEKATEMEPSQYLYWGNLGDARRWVAGMREKSLEAYREALRLARERELKLPDDSTLQGRIAMYAAKSGDTKTALALIEKLKESSANNPSYLYRAAVVKELAGNRAGALAALEAALEKGYALREAANDPELVGLRKEPGFQRMTARIQAKSKKK